MTAEEILQHPEEWVSAYGDYLYKYALFRVRDHHAAEDLVQDTLLSALDARKRFSGESTVRTWLVGILNHKASDLFRRRARERVGATDDVAFEESPERFTAKGHPVVSEWGAEPGKLVEEKEFQKRFAKCLSSLPDRYFEAYTLREMDEKDPEEICNDLGISATNLRVMLHRSRAMLRRCLEENWFGKERSTS